MVVAAVQVRHLGPQALEFGLVVVHDASVRVGTDSPDLMNDKGGGGRIAAGHLEVPPFST